MRRLRKLTRAEALALTGLTAPFCALIDNIVYYSQRDGKLIRPGRPVVFKEKGGNLLLIEKTDRSFDSSFSNSFK